MIRHITLFGAILLLLSSGCDRPEAKAVTSTPESSPTTNVATASPAPSTKPPSEVSSVAATVRLLHDPMELRRYEAPSQALQLWHSVRNNRPSLVLYANNPLLLSTNNFKVKDFLTQLEKQDPKDLLFDNPNPLILPSMTLHAALEAGLFSSVYWIMPSSGEITDLSVDVFRRQMMQFRALSEDEAKSFTLRNGVFSGTARGVPFHAVHPKADLNISGPVAFHFDLSYLASLYKGELKTRLYPLVYETLKHLRKQRVQTVSASFSYSQVTKDVPLGSRFLGDVFYQLFKQPQLLDEKLPEAWQKRADALYLPHMLIFEDARKILLQLAEAQSDDASIHYALYQISRESRSTSSVALKHLADAVERDPEYAYEYLYLAPQALEKGRPDEALRVLYLAHEAKPDNPMMALSLAQALVDQGQGDKAVPFLKQLQALNWSETYYPKMPIFLEQLLTEASH